MSSTHMKMMIALRRGSTPTTPMQKSTAEKNSDSASIGFPPLADGDGAGDRGEEQDARHLEGEQVFPEERRGHGADHVALGHLLARVLGRHHEVGQRLRRVPV